MKWTSPWDGSEFDIRPAHGTVRQWKEGRCWNFACRNGILYVNISPRGYWKLGYCSPDYELMKCQNREGNGYHARGKWYAAVGGKLKGVRSDIILLLQVKKSGH